MGLLVLPIFLIRTVVSCLAQTEILEIDSASNFTNQYTLKNSAPDSPSPVVIKNFTHRLSFLDDVLEGYDKRAWPTYGQGIPTLVRVNVYINSLGSVSASNMEYSMDIYLRQSWQDHRLNLARFGINNNVTLNGEDLVDKIWKPDIFFRNVKKASFHKVTVPNRLIKWSPEGHILYSMRLTLRLACHMSFRHYPLDTQNCHLVFGSYSHAADVVLIQWSEPALVLDTTVVIPEFSIVPDVITQEVCLDFAGVDAQTVDQVEIEWDTNVAIAIEQPIELPEFNLIEFNYDNFTRNIDTGAFSFLNATFRLERQNGYHLIQTYLPTFLIVMISWVSFWLNVDATPARVTLGVTTLLTLTTVASGVRTQLPPVSYVKAIDVWIGTCSVMVFGALLEFTLVNYVSRSKYCPEDFRRSFNIFGRTKKIGNLNNVQEVKVNHTEEIARNTKRALMVDRVCRILFPLLFFIFNAIYWPYYLYVPDK